MGSKEEYFASDKKSKSDNELRHQLEQLSEAEKECFLRLKAWRRDVASREGIPPYVIFNNREAVQLIKSAPRTMGDLLAVEGVSEKRVKRHGAEILEVIHGIIPESREAKSADTREELRTDALDSREDISISEEVPPQSD